MQGITNVAPKMEKGEGFPIGTIIECTQNPGDGWIECDGSSTTTTINGLATLFTGTQQIYSGYSSLCKICYGNGIIVTYSESGVTNMINIQYLLLALPMLKMYILQILLVVIVILLIFGIQINRVHL